MEALSAACGVAQRTLQKGFMQFFQLTPVAYLRERRLQKIHDELLQADACVSVTDVLMRNGINKVAVALGGDAPRVAEGTERYLLGADGQPVFS